MKKLLATFVLFSTVFLSSCGAPSSSSQPVSDPDSSNQDMTDKENQSSSADEEQTKEQQSNNTDNEASEETISNPVSNEPKEEPLKFSYPDAVRGIYVTAHSAGGSKFEKLVQLLDNSDLNAMVIDIKDDYGNITFVPEKEDSPLVPYAKRLIKDPEEMLKTLSEHEIYPIARIVVFKDSILAEKNPELTFKQNGGVWKNRRGEAFVNPYMKQVWDYNISVAKEAARMGFQEIQFDYVRFPEGFENKILDYQFGEYEEQHKTNPVKARVQAITDFIAYAEKELKPLGVQVSVDIFGYTVTLDEAPGIGQNFSKISSHVDVISSMIYPSHWGFYNLGVPKPDLDPYNLVHNYVVEEKKKLFRLENPPVSRPWIQDFTASWLGPGNYKTYGKAEVEAQIRALYESGINEFLIWNAGNSYTPNVDYTPDINKERQQQVLSQDDLLRLEIVQEAEAAKATEEAEQAKTETESTETESTETTGSQNTNKDTSSEKESSNKSQAN